MYECYLHMFILPLGVPGPPGAPGISGRPGRDGRDCTISWSLNRVSFPCLCTRTSEKKQEHACPYVLVYVPTWVPWCGNDENGLRMKTANLNLATTVTYRLRILFYYSKDLRLNLTKRIRQGKRLSRQFHLWVSVRTRYTHVRRVRQRSAKSRGFSPGSPVSPTWNVDRVGWGSK